MVISHFVDWDRQPFVYRLLNFQIQYYYHYTKTRFIWQCHFTSAHKEHLLCMTVGLS